MKKRKTVGYGWVGEWKGNVRTLGWGCPQYLGNANKRGFAATPNISIYVHDDDRFYLCKITVEEVKDKRGRPIVRRAANFR